MVAGVSVPLRQLRAEVDNVAAEKEVVLRCDGHGVAHEDTAVAYQGCGHGAGYATKKLLALHPRT